MLLYRHTALAASFLLLATSCDFAPSGEASRQSSAAPLAFTLDLDAAADTLGLYGNAPTLGYTFDSEGGTLEEVRAYLDGRQVGSDAGTGRLKLDLFDVPDTTPEADEPTEPMPPLPTLRVEARLAYGSDAQRLYRTVEIGAWPARVVKRAPSVAAVYPKLQDGYVTLTWAVYPAGSATSIVVTSHGLTHALPGTARAWVDSLYLGGTVLYTVRASSPAGSTEQMNPYTGATLSLTLEKTAADAGTLVARIPEGAYPDSLVFEQYVNFTWERAGRATSAQPRLPITIAPGEKQRYRVIAYRAGDSRASPYTTVEG